MDWIAAPGFSALPDNAPRCRRGSPHSDWLGYDSGGFPQSHHAPFFLVAPRCRRAHPTSRLQAARWFDDCQSRLSGVTEDVRWRVYKLSSLEIFPLSESGPVQGGIDGKFTN